MKEKSASEFKISLDDETVDPDDTGAPIKKPEAGKKKVEKSTDRRFSRLTFVLFALMIVVVIAGYMDIRNRLLSFHSTGSQETRHLSEDLQSKFSTLSNQFATLEESIKGLTDSGSTLSASVASLDEALKKLETSMNGIKSSKADKSRLDSALKDVDKRISPLSEEIKKVSADAGVMSAKLNAGLTEMSSASARVLNDIQSLNAVMEALQAEKATKKELLAEINHIENVLKTFKNQSEKQSADFATSIRRLELRIRSLEAKAGISTSLNNSLSNVEPAASESGEQTIDTPSPALETPTDLIERDISQ